MRPQHSHICQTRSPVTNCPACKLIRPEVMNAHPRMIAGGMFGPPRPAPMTERTTRD